MKIKVWVVSTCIPERGEGPCISSVFGTESEAEAFADNMLREEWANSSVCDDDGEELDYPCNWREANERIKKFYDDGSCGEWQITSHDVEIGALATALMDAEDGWQEWEAGPKDCDPPALAVVDWRLRNGEVATNKWSETGFWHHDGGHDDIVAWRFSDPHERAARAAGFITIDEGGWAGDLICHKDRLDDRAGPEYGSWQECCVAEGIAIGGAA